MSEDLKDSTRKIGEHIARETQEIRDDIEDKAESLWARHRKAVIAAGVVLGVLVVLAIAYG
jgi:hypothetical protein